MAFFFLSKLFLSSQAERAVRQDQGRAGQSRAGGGQASRASTGSAGVRGARGASGARSRWPQNFGQWGGPKGQRQNEELGAGDWCRGGPAPLPGPVFRVWG